MNANKPLAIRRAESCGVMSKFIGGIKTKSLESQFLAHDLISFVLIRLNSRPILNSLLIFAKP